MRLRRTSQNGRLGEVAIGRLLAFQPANLKLADWPVWSKLSGRSGSSRLVHTSGPTFICNASPMTAERHVAAARRPTSERWQRPNDRRQGAPWMSRAFGYARKRLLSVDATPGFPRRGYRKYGAGRAQSSAKAMFAGNFRRRWAWTTRSTILCSTLTASTLQRPKNSSVAWTGRLALRLVG